MAYNYLELVNKLCRRFNEVELSASEFNSATGFYSAAKDAVNAAIRDINQNHFQWPWNHVAQSTTLTVGQLRYPYPADAKYVDYESFRIRKNLSFGNNTVKLKFMEYDEWLENHADAEYSTQGGFSSGFSIGFSTKEGQGIPQYVFRGQNLEFGLWEIPDKEYVLDYEYFSQPTDLDAATDVPTVPESFEYVIMNGALMHLYAFRDDTDMFDRYMALFDRGVENLRTIYINRYDYIRDRRVVDTQVLGNRYIYTN